MVMVGPHMTARAPGYSKQCCRVRLQRAACAGRQLDGPLCNERLCVMRAFDHFNATGSFPAELQLRMPCRGIWRRGAVLAQAEPSFGLR